jgi:group I intron endonuclease
MGYIYKIVNKIDGKTYIGQTIQDLEERWRQHRKTNSNCRYLKSAIKKHGIENFNFKLVCICFDDDLDKYETTYIKKYNAMVPNGYNLREGGNSSKHHEETKKKISEKLKNRTDLVHSKYKVFQMDMNGTIIQTFNGYTQASKITGVDIGTLWRICNGKGKTAKGFMWKSVEK